MKRHGNLDIAGNVKLRGLVVDDLTTQGGFYSDQLGEVAYKSDVTNLQSQINNFIVNSGFYGITVKQTDGLQSFEGVNVVNFNSDSFYIEQNSPNTDEVIVNFRGSSGSGSGISSITVRESDSTPPAFSTDTIVFDSGYFYTYPTSTGKPSIAIREDNILRDHVNDFDLHKHVSGFYAIRDATKGFITRVNWKNGDFAIVNRNVSDTITSVVGKRYRKTFTRDENNKIIDVTYTRIG